MFVGVGVLQTVTTPFSEALSVKLLVAKTGWQVCAAALQISSTRIETEIKPEVVDVVAQGLATRREQCLIPLQLAFWAAVS